MDAFQKVEDLRYVGYYQNDYYVLMYHHIRVNTSGGKNNSLQNANSS